MYACKPYVCLLATKKGYAVDHNWDWIKKGVRSNPLIRLCSEKYFIFQSLLCLFCWHERERSFPSTSGDAASTPSISRTFVNLHNNQWSPTSEGAHLFCFMYSHLTWCIVHNNIKCQIRKDAQRDCRFNSAWVIQRAKKPSFTDSGSSDKDD